MRCLRSRSTSPSSSTLRVLKEAISRPWLWLKEKEIIEIFVTICVHIYLNMFMFIMLTTTLRMVCDCISSSSHPDPTEEGKKERKKSIYIYLNMLNIKKAGWYSAVDTCNRLEIAAVEDEAGEKSWRTWLFFLIDRRKNINSWRTQFWQVLKSHKWVHYFWPAGAGGEGGRWERKKQITAIISVWLAHL